MGPDVKDSEKGEEANIIAVSRHQAFYRQEDLR